MTPASPEPDRARRLSILGKHIFAFLALASACGCANVTATRVPQNLPTKSLAAALRSVAPTAPTAALLLSRGIDPTPPFNPAEAAIELAETQGSTVGPAGLLALAELHELAGRKHRVGFSEELVRHDYEAALLAATLLFNPPAANAYAPTEEQLERARDIHDRALARFLRRTGGTRFRADQDWRNELVEIGLPLTVRNSSELWNPAWFDEIDFCSDYRITGLREHIRMPGIGVPMFGIRDFQRRAAARPMDGQNRYFPPLQVYPTTVVLRPGNLESGSSPTLEFHDPLRFDAMPGGARTLLLGSDQSTPVAFHFATGKLIVAEQIGMFRPEQFGSQSGLHLIHPYEPGKIPVIFIHGLWSGPKAFVENLNVLRGDPWIRARFQFWFFMYPSGDPYPYTAALFRDELAKVRHDLDPQHKDQALDQIVLVGHSMGGLLSKVTVQNSGDKLWKVMCKQPFEEISLSTQTRQQLRRHFFFEPNRSVRRIVFIATPHRGSKLGDSLIGRFVASLIYRPKDLVAIHEELLARNDASIFEDEVRGSFFTSIDLLRWNDPMLSAIDATPLEPWVTFHSIIGNITKGPLEKSTDGVVPYESSHIERAASEYVIPKSHFCQDDALTIAEIRRILVIHAATAEREGLKR